MQSPSVSIYPGSMFLCVRVGAAKSPSLEPLDGDAPLLSVAPCSIQSINCTQFNSVASSVAQ